MNDFNRASRQELLALAAVLQDTVAAGDDQARWLREEKRRVTEAYAAASDAAADWANVAAMARANASRLRHRAFWRTWVAEQLRLASQFPDMANEAFSLMDDDVLGNALPDLTYSLTFDDGPSRRGGATDRIVEILRKLQMPATFFVLGERFAKRKDATALYAGFDVASHGNRHVEHATMMASMTSITVTRDRLTRAGENARIDLFRPPYGRRGGDVAQWLHRHGVRTVLWNIDSQDWRRSASAAMVAGRVMALMLVRRKGVILFHDTFAIAQDAVPLIRRALGATPVRWASCEAW